MSTRVEHQGSPQLFRGENSQQGLLEDEETQGPSPGPRVPGKEPASLNEDKHILALSAGPTQKPDVNLTESRITMDTSGHIGEELSRLGQLRREGPP